MGVIDASIITERFRDAPASMALRRLTAAALVLPGIAPPVSLATDEDTGDVQYSYYEEGERRVLPGSRVFDPIRVDSMQARGRVTLLDRLKFSFNYAQDTWSGATPITTAPTGLMEHHLYGGASSYVPTNIYFDKQYRLVKLECDSVDCRWTPQSLRPLHMMTTASPETRKQGDFKLGYEWDDMALDVGGGVSSESDYRSGWVNGGGRWDFDQKRTTLTSRLSYTTSEVEAQRDPSVVLFVDATPYERPGDASTVGGERRDWTATLGLARVMDKDSLIQTGLTYTRQSGFLENPYKAVTLLFMDPSAPLDPNGIRQGGALGAMERRPDARNQWTWNLRYVRHVPAFDAALRLDYRFFSDDWGIDAHTFEAAWNQPLGNGWTLTPSVRYYSQEQADFYRPFFVFKQKVPGDVYDGLDYRRLPVSAFSSDHRLSAYGALSGGLTLSKQWAKGIQLTLNAEYYKHAGAWTIGGGGEGSYADFDFVTVNAALSMPLSALASAADGFSSHAGHAGHGEHGVPAPAGVMFDHVLDEGQVMAGYRYMYGWQRGALLHGTNPVGDAETVARACGGQKCSVSAKNMYMHMHMFDLMYAPTDRLTLMLMPQFVDMDMQFRALAGAPPPSGGGHNHAGSSHAGHSSGGIGDLGLYALVKLLRVGEHRLHLGIGVTAPTGDVGQTFETGRHGHVKIGGHPERLHYGMQPGSGTWDFKPSLTYTAHQADWSWGGQISGTHRMEERNEAGFAFGDVFQATAWGGYRLNDWLSASVRGVYTEQGAVEGHYKKPHDQGSPPDNPSNYGGRFVDVGFGLNATVTGGSLKGNRLAFEWLQPVLDDVNGYQLGREGGLSASWSYGFN